MNDKTRQIIEGLKIFQNYDHEIIAQDDRISINIFGKIKAEEFAKLESLDWNIDSPDEDLWSIFV